MLSHSQNFINNKKLINELLRFIEFSVANLVLEIGPGKGAVTDELVKRAQKVVAVEADRGLFDFLKNKYANTGNIQIENQDFLEYELPKEPFIIVLNIPFNITADIIRKITGDESQLGFRKHWKNRRVARVSAVRPV